MSRISLKEAREQGKLDEFIKEHEKDEPGDADRLDKVLKKIVKPTEPPKHDKGRSCDLKKS